MVNNLTLGMLWPDDPEFIAIVPLHWHKFPAPDPLYNYIIGIYIGVVGITAVFGNLLVICLFALTKSLRSPPNFLIVNLAISDCSFSALNGFPLLTIAAFNQRWTWGKLACEIYGGVAGVFGFVSLSTNMCIALDRYFVIAQPIKSFSRSSYGKVFFMVVFTWIWGCAWMSPPLFGFGRFVTEGLQISCSFDYFSRDLNNLLFLGGMYIFGFSVPVLITVFAYAQIVLAVRQNEVQLKKMAQKLNAENPTSMKSSDKKADIEAAKTSAILITLFLMSWVPYALICFLSLIGKIESLTPFTCTLPVVFAKTGAAYNPFVYAIKHPKFRLELEKRLPFLIACCPPDAKERQKATTVTKLAEGAATAEESGGPAE